MTTYIATYSIASALYLTSTNQSTEDPRNQTRWYKDGAHLYKITIEEIADESARKLMGLRTRKRLGKE